MQLRTVRAFASFAIGSLIIATQIGVCTAANTVTVSTKAAAPTPCTPPKGHWPQADPYVLPKSCPNPLTGAEITVRLNDLFNNWTKANSGGKSAASDYSLFLLMMPQWLDVKTDAAGALAPPTPSDTTAPLHYYKLQDQSVVINAVKLLALNNLPAFSGANDPNDQIFIKVDSLGVTVPAKVAHLLAKDFTAGFVTRLMLQAQNQALAARKVNTVFPQLDITQPIAPGAALTGFKDKATYSNCPDQNNKPTACGNLEAAITNQFVVSSPEMVGLTLGWKAASQLLAFDTTKKHQYVADAWQLIHNRYSTRDIGKLVGFTLNYMVGYTQNERIAKGAQPNDNVTDNNALLVKVTNNKTIASSKQFVQSVYNSWLAESFAISQLNVKANWQLLDDYANVLEGYSAGVNKSFGDIYTEEGNIEWSAGYARGFQDGYEAGYAAGWYDGDAYGNAQAWAQANQIITGLQNQIASLQNQLNNASQGNSGNNCSGFWGTISCAVNTFTGIVGPASTIIGIVSSLF